MEIWKIVWIVSFVVAFMSFLFISSRVIWRGFAEMKELLEGLEE